MLADGTGLVANHQFYLAARPYAEQHADIVRIVIEELAKVDEWGQANQQEVAEQSWRAQTGLDAGVVALAAQRYAYGVKPITPEVIADAAEDRRRVLRLGS